MASFPLSEIGNVVAHPAKGVTWSKGAIIVKRLAFPKGAIPPHLAGYTERFKEAGRACAAATVGARGAARVHAINSCVAAKLGRHARVPAGYKAPY